ncbi:MAG TPA: VOC family protein [Actinomycetota bacterium]|nr:VOC family protein [Actinomycetota bacterium]
MSEQAPAIVGIAALAVDCSDPPELARWWRRLLGGTVEVDPDDDATLHTPGGLAIDFLRVPEAKSVKNRLHLDLRSTDLAEATEQAVALGATRADDVYDGGEWQVLRDPEGNEFCLLRPRR